MSITRLLLQSIDKANKRSTLFCKNDRIVVGISGGPDSTALFLLLKKIERKHSLSFVAAHLNHGLSGQAREYELFCRSLAKKYSTPILVKKVAIRRMAKKYGQTIEEAGRNERYAFFSQAAKRFKANKIATAHTLDDQAETILMRMIRGTGLRGLAGIPASRSHGKLRVIRPLLHVTKQALLLFLRLESQAYLRDASNDGMDFTRNQIRHLLLPLIKKKLNPQISDALSDLSQTSASAMHLIRGLAERAWSGCLLYRGDHRIDLDCLKWVRLHPAVADEVIWMAVESLQGDRTGVGYSHLSSIRELSVSAHPLGQLHLPKGLRVLKKQKSRSLTGPGGKTIISLNLLPSPRKGG